MRDARSGRYRPSDSIRDYSPRLSVHYRSTCTDVDLFYLPVYKCTCATYLARYGIADENAPLNLKWNCLSVRTLSFCLITWTFCEWAWSLPLIAITTIHPITLHPFFFFLFTNHSQLSSFDDFKFLDSILMIANHHLTFWHLKNANKIRCAQNNVSLEWKFSNIFVFLFFYSTRKNLRGVEGTRDELILACQPWTIAHPYSSLIAGVKDGGQPRQPAFTTFLRVSSRTLFISFSRLPRVLSSTHERIVLRWCYRHNK